MGDFSRNGFFAQVLGTIGERNEGKGEGKGLKRDEEEEEEEEEQDLAEVRPSVRIPPPRSLPAPVSSKGSLEGGEGGRRGVAGPGERGGRREGGKGTLRRDTAILSVLSERACLSPSSRI